MQNAAGDGVAAAVPTTGMTPTAPMVSDLVSLIEHVQTSLRADRSGRSPGKCRAGSQESSANVIVLDDVTPRYSKASTRAAGLRRQALASPCTPARHGAHGTTRRCRCERRASTVSATKRSPYRPRLSTCFATSNAAACFDT